MTLESQDSHVLELLKSFKLCAELKEQELQFFATAIEEVKLEGGDQFIKQDSQSAQVYFIIEGRVEVEISMIGNRSNAVIATMGPGETVGEFALVRSGRRSASAKALGKVRALKAEAFDLLALFETNPRIGYIVFRNLNRILVERLVDTNMFTRNALSQLA